MPRCSRKTSGGFTIAELLVSLAIITVLTGMMLANFHGGQQSSELRLAAEITVSQLHDIQTAALGGRLVSVCSGGAQANQVCEAGKNPSVTCTGGGTCQRRVVPGYGIRFTVGESTYLVFDDVNGNNVYNAGEEIATKPFVSTGLVKLGATNAGSTLDVVFVAPDAKQKFNGSDAPDLLQLTLRHLQSDSERNVKLYRIAGKIEHD